MRGKPLSGLRRFWKATVLLLAALGPIAGTWGQDEAIKSSINSSVMEEGVKPIPTIPTGEGIKQAQCASCGGGMGGFSAGDGSGCGCGSGGQCSPSRHDCDCCCSSDTCIGRFINGMYQCVCCPDPCFDPQWLPVANAAFFLDTARPSTNMQFRINQMWDMNSPDRAEYFWGKEGGKGPKPPIRSIEVSEFRMYNEAAAGKAGISIDIPYRRIEGDVNSSGFADMIIGTKAMLLDCQLMQITFGFKTYVPSGAAPKGLGTGHVSLEPSLIWAIRLAPNTYLQAQTGLFIPLGGDPAYQGNIFDYRFSLNQILWKPCNDLQLVGTLELTGMSFLNGQRTDDLGNAIDVKSNLLAGGPGLRVFICDKIDTGIGSSFAFTNQRWAEEMIRIDFRWRF